MCQCWTTEIDDNRKCKGKNTIALTWLPNWTWVSYTVGLWQISSICDCLQYKTALTDEKSKCTAGEDEVPFFYTLHSLWSQTESSHMVQIGLISGDVIASVGHNGGHKLLATTMKNKASKFTCFPSQQYETDWMSSAVHERCGSLYSTAAQSTFVQTEMSCL